MKFTYTGGVTIQVRTAAKAADGITLQFTVADTGIGIPEDSRERLFEPFYQLEQFMVSVMKEQAWAWPLPNSLLN